MTEPRESIRIVQAMQDGAQIDIDTLEPEVREEVDSILGLLRLARSARAPESSPAVDARVPVGEAIANARAAAGLTQAELAALAGTTQARVCEVETSQSDARLSTITRLADALKLSVRLIHDDDLRGLNAESPAVDAGTTDATPSVKSALGELVIASTLLDSYSGDKTRDARLADAIERVKYASAVLRTSRRSPAVDDETVKLLRNAADHLTLTEYGEQSLREEGGDPEHYARMAGAVRTALDALAAARRSPESVPEANNG